MTSLLIRFIENKWTRRVAVLSVMVSTITILFIFYDAKVNECTSHPLVYASQKYEELYGYALTGSATFKIPNSPLITFDSEGVSAKYIGQGRPILNFNLSDFVIYNST